MNILFCSYELGEFPSGVITVITETCSKWGKVDNLTILLNKRHWAKNILLNKFNYYKNVSIKLNLIISASEIKFYINNYFVKLIISPIYPIINLINIIYLVFWLRKNKFDAVFSHNGGWPGGELNRLVILASWFACVPKRILVIHNIPNIPKSNIKILFNKIYELIIGKITTDIVTVSEACKMSILCNTNFNTKISVIYNGIKSEADLKNDFKKSWNDCFTIAFIGEIHPRKGLPILIDALKLIETPFNFLIIGSGEDSYVHHIKSLAGEIIYPTYFLGFCKDVEKFYPFIDLVVLPSISFESFGMVLVEAMKYNKPVICSDFGGMKEVVENGVTGIVFPSGDSISLSNNINTIMNNKDMQLEMGKAGYRRMMTFFSSQAMVSNYRDLILRSYE